MPLIDERGRIFGRLNLVDAAVAAMVLVLLPAGYGAYLLFKEPAPKLSAVLPDTLRQAPNLQVEIRGVNFRPYMRVSFNGLQGRTFLFANPKTAVVELPDMPPGKYDVVLYDYMQEVSRLPGAFTLQPPPEPPTIELELTGVLTSMTANEISGLAPGHMFPESGGAAEVLWVGEPRSEVLRIKTGDKAMLTVPVDGPLEVPVRLRSRCFIATASDGSTRCTVGGIPLAPDANVQYPGLGRALNFRVSEVHYAGRSKTATATVRFVMSPETRAKLRVSDQDLGARAFPAGTMAKILSLADRGDATSAMPRDDRVRQAIPTNRLVAVEAIVAIPVEDTPIGWTYKSVPVKVGAPFSFETDAYLVSGGIIDVSIPSSKPAAEPSSHR